MEMIVAIGMLTWAALGMAYAISLWVRDLQRYLNKKSS